MTKILQSTEVQVTVATLLAIQAYLIIYFALNWLVH